MLSTPFSRVNADFSTLAHGRACELVYPRFFGVVSDKLTVEDVTGVHSALDTELGVDRVIRVTTQSLHQPLTFTVQERFRRPRFKGFRDITLTEWNLNSDLPSELYKIHADYFMYAYFDDTAGQFVGETVIVNVPSLKRRLGAAQIEWSRRENPRSNQVFMSLTFDELRRVGVCACYINWDVRGNA